MLCSVQTDGLHLRRDVEALYSEKREATELAERRHVDRLDNLHRDERKHSRPANLRHNGNDLYDPIVVRSSSSTKKQEGSMKRRKKYVKRSVFIANSNTSDHDYQWVSIYETHHSVQLPRNQRTNFVAAGAGIIVMSSSGEDADTIDVAWRTT